jgi:NAD(P)-dependent dehydrogenase (short-subunit alcohol dehydrogenase family)
VLSRHLILFSCSSTVPAPTIATPTLTYHPLQIFTTNLFGVINGLNTYVPSFQSRSNASPAAIVITGSKQGITNPPGNPAYNASKAAVKTLAEHLSWDLRENKGVSVHLLVPGWTFTGLVSVAFFCALCFVWRGGWGELGARR